MAGLPIRIGPVALSITTTTNIFSPAAAGAGTGYTPTASYAIIRHIHILNKTTTDATFSLWINASGVNTVGSEFWGIGQKVSANSSVDYFGVLKLTSADFLVGGASIATTLTLHAEGELYLA